MSEDADGKSWNNANYMRWIRDELKGNPIMIDPFNQEVEELDLLVLPGGSDVNPRRYADFWHPDTGLPNRALEFFDEVVLPEYIKAQVPIFGICRGLQTLNVLLGGTLNPDSPEPTSSGPGDPVHFVRLNDTGELLESSSNHHQSIRRLAQGFSIWASGYANKWVSKSKTADLTAPLSIEGIAHKEWPIFATQFHPEKQFETEQCRDLTARVTAKIKSIMK